jgi:hypothetical protein
MTINSNAPQGIEVFESFAKEIINKFSAEVKAVLRRVEMIQSTHGQSWPSWCYIPSGIVFEEVTALNPTLPSDVLFEFATCIQGVLTWMVHKRAVSYSEAILHRLENGPDRSENFVHVSKIMAMSGHAVFLIDGISKYIDFDSEIVGQLVFLNYDEGSPPVLTVISFTRLLGGIGAEHYVTPIPHFFHVGRDSFRNVVQKIYQNKFSENDPEANSEMRELANYLAKIGYLIEQLPNVQTSHRDEINTGADDYILHGINDRDVILNTPIQNKISFENPIQWIKVAEQYQYLH